MRHVCGVGVVYCVGVVVCLLELCLFGVTCTWFFTHMNNMYMVLHTHTHTHTQTTPPTPLPPHIPPPQTTPTACCGLPPGPYGLLGNLEAASYLTVLSIIAWSVYRRLVRGKEGLPAGPYGALPAVEGLSYAALIGGIVVVSVQVRGGCVCVCVRGCEGVYVYMCMCTCVSACLCVYMGNTCQCTVQCLPLTQYLAHTLVTQILGNGWVPGGPPGKCL